MAPAPGTKLHGYRLISQPGAGGQPRQFGAAPLLTRVSSVFSTGEPMLLGTNQAAADVYTMAHLASGAVLGFGRAPWWSILAVAVGWTGIDPHHTAKIVQGCMNQGRPAAMKLQHSYWTGIQQVTKVLNSINKSGTTQCFAHIMEL